MLRKYAYLTALARERHFGRAAAACHVSQPTLSAAIRQLEADLGVPIVERGQRFQGFTPQGERVLRHARRILAEQEALTRDLAGEAGGLAGLLRLGVIPTALPAAAHLLGAFARRHPGVRVSLAAASSRDIQRGLDDFDLDAGLTYLDNEPLSGVRRTPLYAERHFLLAARTPDLAARHALTWAEAAELPLCLLTPDMQNRRIADSAFRLAERTVTPALETNSISTLVAMVRQGPWAAVVPGQILTVAAADPALVALPLVAPEVAHTIGLVHAERTPLSPLVRALAAVAAEPALPAALAADLRAAFARHGVEQ